LRLIPNSRNKKKMRVLEVILARGIKYEEFYAMQLMGALLDREILQFVVYDLPYQHSWSQLDGSEFSRIGRVIP
jgi:hypothetical protein